jgi:hypothetical protein
LLVGEEEGERLDVGEFEMSCFCGWGVDGGCEGGAGGFQGVEEMVV